VSAGRAQPRLAGTLLALSTREIETAHGRFALRRFHDLESGQPFFALTFGEIGGDDPLLARVHSACATSEAFGACDCDCAEQLDASLAALAAEGRGALFYLMQEGRGAGLAAKARDRMWVQASGQRLTTFDAYERMGLPGDHRRYGAVRFALELLGVRAPLRLLSNNPDKHAALEAEKIRIEELVPLHSGASPFNLHYLASKSRSGHRLPAADASRAAALPAAVEPCEPFALPAAPQLVVLARYFLPVRIPGAREPVWFELSLHFDTELGRERIALRLDKDAACAPLEFLGRDVLVERFGATGRASQRARWLAAADRMAQRGAGCAVFLPAEIECEAESEPEPDAASVALFEWYRTPRAARAR
jgi:GTP cyclohydrolase II